MRDLSADRPSALAPFRVRSFRFQWPADLLTSWAFEMEMLILGWYMLVETGSVLMLTIYGALLYIGTLIAPMFGVIGDRMGQRNLLCGLRATYALLAAALCVLAFAKLLNPTMVLVIAALAGIVRPSDQGVRAALVADTMPAEWLISAMSIARTTSDSARIVGALSGAGLFAALGMAWAYLVVTLFYIGGLLLTLGVTSPRPLFQPLAPAAESAPLPSPWRDLREGIAYVWNTPQLLAAMWFAFLANAAAFPLSNGLLPYVAREVYHTTQTGLGILVASCSAGALAASIGLSLASGRIRSGRMMIIYAAGWYAVLLGFAWVQRESVGIVFLVAAGVMQSLSLVPLTVVLLRTSGERFRGRVMGVRMLAIYSLPLGLLAAGVLIERFGFHVTATIYAVAGLLFTAIIGIRWRNDLWRADAPANMR